MPENKSQLARLLFIDRKIREGMQKGRLANCTSLALEYEVSSKTVLRDIDYLRLSWEAPIEYDARRKGYYYTEENYALPAVHLNEGDLFGLCIAQRGLEQYRNTPLYGQLAAVFRKIERSLPEQVTLAASWVDSQISVVPARQTTIKPEVWEAVSQGLRRKRRLAIRYQKPGARAPAEREVDPYHLTSYQGEWYLLAHCHRRDAKLTFAVSRISEARLLELHFAVPTGFNPAALSGKSFGIMRGKKEYTVRLRFSSQAAPYILERTWHPAQQLARHRDGGVTLTLPVSELLEIKRWVLSWGAEAKVLKPRELARLIQVELAEMAAIYAGGRKEEA